MALLHHLCLVVHLVCLAVFGASALGGTVLDRAMWTAVQGGRNAEALTLAQTGSVLGRSAQIAAVFALLSGVGMLATTGFVQWGQHWLYAKLVLFVALAACGGAIGGRTMRRVVEVLGKRAAAPAAEAQAGVAGELAAMRSRMAIFHVVMPAMLIAVLTLVVVRP